MSKEDPYRQMTDKTRQRIQRSYQQRAKMEEEEVNSLPPRSELHGDKRKKSKNKVRYPLIRLLALFFILLPITIFAIYSNRSEKVPVQTEPVDQGDHEKISIEDSVEGENLSNKKSNKTLKEDEKEENEADKVGKNEAPPADKQIEAPVSPGATQPNNQVVEPKNVTYNKTVKHTVQPGETLFRISMKYYQSQTGIEKIKKANNLTNDEIQEGQVLIIPQ